MNSRLTSSCSRLLLTTFLLGAVGFGCTARGGGGGGVGGGNDASVDDTPAGSDLGNDMDVGTPEDTGLAPEDTGLAPEDRGKVNPDDVGTPPADTGSPPACGDGFCNGTETCVSCQMDCGPCAASCGDGMCQSTESCTSCPGDCGACAARCGDGACNGSETCTTCPSDCGACAPRCGDSMCNGTETCSTCPSDCGACEARCGDSMCNGAETCSTCPADCGECMPRCGDNLCNGTETCTTCPSDCGSCTNPCPSLRGCGACVADSRCGWCGLTGTCAAGNASGPTNANDCFPVIGMWTRSPASCPSDAGVTDTGPRPDAGSGNITRTCTTTADGLQSECGWRLGNRYTCTPGSTITVGCTNGADAGSACGARLGSCSADPMIRVCPGTTECSYAGRIAATGAGSGTGYGEDDACGLCPVGRFLCPSSGSVTVYERSYYRDRAATCSVSRI